MECNWLLASSLYSLAGLQKGKLSSELICTINMIRLAIQKGKRTLSQKQHRLARPLSSSVMPDGGPRTNLCKCGCLHKQPHARQNMENMLSEHWNMCSKPPVASSRLPRVIVSDHPLDTLNACHQVCWLCVCVCVCVILLQFSPPALSLSETIMLLGHLAGASIGKLGSDSCR